MKKLLLALILTLTLSSSLLAKKYMHNYYGGVNLFQTLRLIETFEEIDVDKEAKEKELFIVFNSGGGSLMHMKAQIGVIKLFRSKGIRVHTVIFDNCHSACVNLFLQGEKRYAMHNSHMIIHQPRFSMSMRMTKDRLKDLKDVSREFIKEQCDLLNYGWSKCNAYFKRTRTNLDLGTYTLKRRKFIHKIIPDYRDLLND